MKATVFGNICDAFAELRDVAEQECTRYGAAELREWAAALARYLGEEHNLQAAWPTEGDDE